MSKPEFVYTTYIRTTPERLWQGLTDPAFTRRWHGIVFESNWKPGSTVTVRYPEHDVTIADPAQVVLESDPYKRLSYTWHTFTPEWAAVSGFSDELLGGITSTTVRSLPDQTPRGARRPSRRHDRPVPAIPQSTKVSLQQRLSEHARKHWAQLSGVQLRFRGTFADVSGQLHDGEVLPLCRLRYGGSAARWGVAVYLASKDGYEDAVLPTGGFAGPPEEALDCACGLYLNAPDS
jgi:uncharacterized protein YndB with AHSA1/START domain